MLIFDRLEIGIKINIDVSRDMTEKLHVPEGSMYEICHVVGNAM